MTKSTVADTFDFAANTVDYVADMVDYRRYGRIFRQFWRHTGDKVEFDSLSQSTLSPTRLTLSKVGDFFHPNVERPLDFVASVYGAKVTRSTSTSTKLTVLNLTVRFLLVIVSLVFVVGCIVQW